MAKYAMPLDKEPAVRKRRWWRFALRHLTGISLALMVSLIIVVVLWPYVVVTVPSGKVGVYWKRVNGFDLYCWCFVGRGTILDPRELREEGLHIIAPWDKLFLYNLRLQSTTQTINAISNDGVSVTAQINVRYQLLHDHVAVLHKFIGPDYLQTVIAPEIGSQARQVISQYPAEEVYKSRDKIQSEIGANTRKSLGAHLNQLVQPEAMEQPDPKHYNDFLQDSIEILDTLVLSIDLPPQIVGAINRQTEQFYLIQEYKFRVEREAQESKRKQIEANGIAAFQRTVSQGISDSYLRWRGIEATLALASSPNAKIVVIGTGKDGLPIILGNADTAAPTTGPQAGRGTAVPGAPAPTEKPPPGPVSSAPEPTPAAASPAPAEKEPPEAQTTAPAAAPGNGGTTKSKSSPGSPNGGTPPPSSSALESVLSRISGALRPAGSRPDSGSESK